MMNFSNACGSCAGQSISNLGSHKDPVDAMVAFCKNQLLIGGSGYTPFGTQSKNPGFTLLCPHFVWIAGPEVPGKGHSSPSKWYAYGTEFAAYIEKYGLGKVATTGPIINYKYHPDTTCQIWIWTPDQKAMEAWYTAWKDGTLTKIEALTPAIPKPKAKRKPRVKKEPNVVIEDMTL